MKFLPRSDSEVALNYSCIVNKLNNLKFLQSSPADICTFDTKSVFTTNVPFSCLDSPAHKKVLFLIKSSLTKVLFPFLKRRGHTGLLFTDVIEGTYARKSK